MATHPRQHPILGLARRIGWGHNSLRRPVDRVEGLVVVLVWLATLVFAFGGVAFGLRAAEADLAASTQQMAHLHTTTGVMLDSAVAATDSNAMQLPVEVRYTDQTGTTHTGRTSEAVGMTAGTTVPVWLDARGTIAPAPMTPDDAIVRGATEGAMVAAGAEGLLLAVCMVARWRLKQRKFAAIDHEWAQFATR